MSHRQQRLSLKESRPDEKKEHKLEVLFRGRLGKRHLRNLTKVHAEKIYFSGLKKQLFYSSITRKSGRMSTWVLKYVAVRMGVDLIPKDRQVP